MDKIAELVKTGKVREISDMRDETDLNLSLIHISPSRAAAAKATPGCCCSGPLQMPAHRGAGGWC